jgi:alkylation response protein AidB-like acyl-CoA dehydrogenase
MEYRADLRDVKFNLFEWLDLDRVLSAGRFSEFGRDDLGMILDEALKVCRGSLAACNEEGDRVGVQWKGGSVTLPESFHKAYRDMAEGGWCGATASPEWGGMGLPGCVGTGIQEFITGANTSLSLTLLLGHGTAHLIESFGTDELKKAYCEKMYTGAWAGTMCLTEPGAGSDLGDVKTKAAKQPDGSYLLQGEKIFITSGDHDLTENIIHAVLARTPEAPTGAKGLSLFVVPKFRLNPDGTPGQANDVHCAKIEHKMGIHGSPTCALVFGANGACEGYLLGKERHGLLLMFQMMNGARYEVGIQGLAIGSAAHQAALAYTRERLQGRPHTDRDPHSPQVPIVNHPDVRRMLLFQAATVQAMRAILTYTAWCMDMARVTEGPERDLHQGMVEILTPICKAWCSDAGYQASDSAMQCYGGYGYTGEFPAEQYVRDCRIAAIYEGTNAIQALDLIGRKFKMKGGVYLDRFVQAIVETGASLQGDPVLGEAAGHLSTAIALVNGATGRIGPKAQDPLPGLLNAVPFLESIGNCLGAHLLLQQAKVARAKLGLILTQKGVDGADAGALRALLADDADAAFYHNKVQAALFFCRRVLPLVKARLQPMEESDMSPMEAFF